ncbi:MAG: hypothetical protein ACREIW_07920, partial [Chthoniobacterales bacterium]
MNHQRQGKKNLPGSVARPVFADLEARRDGGVRMDIVSPTSKHKWRPKVGWGVPIAWLTLCVV